MRLIDADLFANNVKTWAENIRDFRSDNKCFFTEENILKAIDEQPTVEVEVVKHGHWINAYSDIEPNPMLMYLTVLNAWHEQEEKRKEDNEEF